MLNCLFSIKPRRIDLDALADKVIEKLENKTTETPTVQGFERLLF